MDSENQKNKTTLKKTIFFNNNTSSKEINLHISEQVLH